MFLDGKHENYAEKVDFWYESKSEYFLTEFSLIFRLNSITRFSQPFSDLKREQTFIKSREFHLNMHNIHQLSPMNLPSAHASSLHRHHVILPKEAAKQTRSAHDSPMGSGKMSDSFRVSSLNAKLSIRCCDLTCSINQASRQIYCF